MCMGFMHPTLQWRPCLSWGFAYAGLDGLNRSRLSRPHWHYFRQNVYLPAAYEHWRPGSPQHPAISGCMPTYLRRVVRISPQYLLFVTATLVFCNERRYCWFSFLLSQVSLVVILLEMKVELSVQILIQA